MSLPALVAALGYLTEARSRARWALDPRPIAELAVVRMASLAEMQPLPEVLARLETLEQSVRGSAASPSRPAPAPEARTAEKKKPAPPVADDRAPEPPAEAEAEPTSPPKQKRRLEDAMSDPLVQKALDLFDGRIVNIDE
jgi:hypothetical protein